MVFSTQKSVVWFHCRGVGAFSGDLKRGLMMHPPFSFAIFDLDHNYYNMLAKCIALGSLATLCTASNLRTTSSRSTFQSTSLSTTSTIQIPLSSLLELTPKDTSDLKEYVNTVKGRNDSPPPSRGETNNVDAAKELDGGILHQTSRLPGVTAPKPRVVKMCSSGDLSNVKVHVNTEGIATEGFQVQAVITDTSTGQVVPLSAMTVVPSMPFWLGVSPGMKDAAAMGGAAAESRDGKATQDLILKASTGSTLLGPAEYELHLQIVSPDPNTIASDFTGTMVGDTKYNYGRMQTLLDEISFVPIQIEDCGDSGKGKSNKEKDIIERPASVSMVAELQHTEADSYFKMTDVDDAAKTAFAHLAGDHIERDQVADFRLEDGDGPGRTKLSLRLIFSNRKLAHLAALEMMKEKEHWEDIVYKTLQETLTSVGVGNVNLKESPIRHFLIMEHPYEDDDKAKTICCLARTAKCMACTRGINIKSFCSLEPQTPGCSSPVDPLRDQTVSKYMVDVILRVHKPSHSVGIFEGSTDVPKELQASMQTSMSVLNYADPDMAVKSVQVELANDGKEKIPLVHVAISTSTFDNAKQLATILSESSTVQKDFMGKSLTDAFHATKVSRIFFLHLVLCFSSVLDVGF